MPVHSVPIRLADEVGVLLRHKLSYAVSLCAKRMRGYRFVFLSVQDRLGEIQVRRMLTKQLHRVNADTEVLIILGGPLSSRRELRRWPGEKAVIAVMYEPELGLWLSRADVSRPRPLTELSSTDQWEWEWKSNYTHDDSISELCFIRVGAYRTYLYHSVGRVSGDGYVGCQFTGTSVYHAAVIQDADGDELESRFRAMYKLG